jgi:hypothetical protein
MSHSGSPAPILAAAQPGTAAGHTHRGFYVIEDLWTAYCPGFGGDAEDLNAQTTSVALLKTLIDLIHYEERPSADGADPIRTQIAGLHVYHNIAFIEKGVNAEGGIPASVPRSTGLVNPPAPTGQDNGNGPPVASTVE